MLLIKFLIYFQNIFIAQAAVMKITNLPLNDHSRSQKYNYQAIFNNNNNIKNNKHETKRDSSSVESMDAICKEPIKPNKTHGRLECEPVPIDQKVFIATHHNGDAYIERKSEKERQALQHTGGRMRLPGKREASSNLTADANVSNNSSTADSGVKDSFAKISKLLHPDLDSFYDSELIRKLSDSNGKLPKSLKLVIPPDKEPIVVYNESEDEGFKTRNFMKREAITSRSNIYYDYNYYDEQQADNRQFNSGQYNVRKKYSNERRYTSEKLSSPDGSPDDGNKEVSKRIAIDNNTEPLASTPGPESYLSFDPVTLLQEIKEPKNRTMFQIDSFDDINVIAPKRGTCPPPEAPGKQGCHPVGSGLPKNPIMPSLIKDGKDPEYEKLMKGETSEKVIKTIVDKIHKNPSMAVELGICDFDLGEMRNLFKKMRNRDKKDCCSKLIGEFKCFLTWMLTLEPSRKKRAETIQEESSKRFQTCNQFPKFDLMGGECYRKPSPQYEKLVQRVEEYKDENNVK